MLEKEIQKQILDYLKVKSYFFWRNNSGAFMREGHFYKFGDSGSPDIFLVRDGKIYGLECKNEKGRQSDTQKDWEARFTQNGGIYMLVRSLDDVMKVL